jgi:hypothetical protein
VFSRGTEQTFTSRILDTGLADPTYTSCSFACRRELPERTSLSFQLRSAKTTEGLQGAAWYGPTLQSPKYEKSGEQVNPVHNGQRYLQYQATFTSQFGNTPVLEQVEIRFH